MADTQISSMNELIKKGAKDIGFNPGKAAKNGMTLAFVLLAIGAGIALYHFILPYLVDIVWGTLQLAIGLGLGVLLVVFAMAQWRNFRLWNEMLADKVFNGIVSKAPFLMQERQIRHAEDNIQKMIGEKEKIVGTYAGLNQKLEKNKQDFATAQAGEKLARDNNRQDMVASSQSAQMRANNYIIQVGPIVKNMKYMIDFVTDASKVLLRRLKDAKADLDQNRDIYDSVVVGAETMRRLREAMTGDVQLNSDAERAQVAAMKTIALSVGQITTSMEIISDFTSNANFEDASKVLAARTQLEKLQIAGVGNVPVDNSMFGGIGNVKQVQINGASEFPI